MDPHPSMHPPIHASIHAPTHPCILPLIHPCTHSSMHPSTHPSMNPPIHLSLCPCIHLYFLPLSPYPPFLFTLPPFLFSFFPSFIERLFAMAFLHVRHPEWVPRMGSEAWGGLGAGLATGPEKRECRAPLLLLRDPKSLVYNSKQKTMQNFRMEAVSRNWDY